jgi:hypothetical protein
MRILFDQGTPVPIRKSLKGHTVRTAEQQGWSTLSNGRLLRAAEDAGFDVLVTPDQNMPHQQNLAGRKIAVVVLNKANWQLIRKAMPEIVAAIKAAKPGSFTEVSIPSR